MYQQKAFPFHPSYPPRIKYGVNSSGYPVVFWANFLDSRFHGNDKKRFAVVFYYFSKKDTFLRTELVESDFGETFKKVL
jgi:hypothetical protein